MATETRVQAGSNPPVMVPARRLWFGLVGSAAAWVSLGVSDILITWRSCFYNEQQGLPAAHPAARAIYILVAFLLFATVLIAGSMSYRNWRTISKQRDILEANATDAREFVALLGVVISTTLGMGVLWLSIPVFIIQLCARWR